MYRNYNDMQNETEKIKHLDLIRVAEDLGYSFHKKGSTYECNEEKGLVYFPNTNSFYHFYDNFGGSVIDFVMKYRGFAFPEAMKSLEAYTEGKTYIPRGELTKEDTRQPEPELRQSGKGNIKLPEENDNYRRVFAYLNKSRGINAGIISRLMHEGRIYEEKEHHNVVFVGTDKNNTPRHAFIRGTITGKQFRGDTKDSDKDYGFNIKGSNNILIVFEAPIDLLSYMTIFPETRCHLLALGMLSSSPIQKYIDEHPEIKNVSFLLDEDVPGCDATLKYEDEFTSKGFNIIKSNLREKMVSSGCKDVNEYLVYLNDQIQDKNNNKNKEIVKEHIIKPEVRKYGRTI